MNSQDAPRPIADLLLERYRLGELPPADMERLRQLAETDEDLRARLEALGESDQEILERYPAAWMSRQIESRLDEATEPAAARSWGARLGIPWIPRLEWPRLSLSSAIPIALVLVVLISLPAVFGPDPDSTLNGLGDPTTRIKGDPGLQLFRQTDTGSEPLADGASARAHDVILIQYRAGGHARGVILSMDGRGAVTLHLPDHGPDALELEQGGAVSLAFAYELDDAPHWERFYFITADRPFAVETVLRAARSASAAATSLPAPTTPMQLELPDDLKQAIFTLSKEAGNGSALHEEASDE